MSTNFPIYSRRFFQLIFRLKSLASTRTCRTLYLWHWLWKCPLHLNLFDTIALDTKNSQRRQENYVLFPAKLQLILRAALIDFLPQSDSKASTATPSHWQDGNGRLNLTEEITLPFFSFLLHKSLFLKTSIDPIIPPATQNTFINYLASSDRPLERIIYSVEGDAKNRRNGRFLELDLRFRLALLLNSVCSSTGCRLKEEKKPVFKKRRPTQTIFFERAISRASLPAFISRQWSFLEYTSKQHLWNSNFLVVNSTQRLYARLETASEQKWALSLQS